MILIGLSACASNEIEATVIRKYGWDAYKESFRIYKGTSSSGTLKLSISGQSAVDNNEYYFSLCMAKGQTYYIAYYDNNSYGWSYDSYVHIKYGDQTIYKGKLSNGNSSSDTFTYPNCGSNEIQATIIRQYGADCAQETVKIYKGTSSYGTLIMNKQGKDEYLFEQYQYLVCLAKGQS